MFRTYLDLIGGGVGIAGSRDTDYVLREAGLRRSGMPLAHPAMDFEGGHTSDYAVLRVSRPRGMRTR